MMHRRHPEQEDDELFIDNFEERQVREVLWKTKRVGKLSYNKQGLVMQDRVPMFVKRQEVVDAGRISIFEKDGEQGS
jgi:hypothetical protein